MGERPLLFSAPMVRALLAGKKTVTRRPVTWRPGAFAPPQTEPTDHPGTLTWEPKSRHLVGHTHPDGVACGAPVLRCPALAGDRLWVRETWTTGYPGTADPYLYRATYEGGADHRSAGCFRWPWPLGGRVAERLKITSGAATCPYAGRVSDGEVEHE